MGLLFIAFIIKITCTKHLNDISHQLSNTTFSTVIFTLLSAVGNEIPQVHIWYPSVFPRAYISLLHSKTKLLVPRPLGLQQVVFAKLDCTHRTGSLSYLTFCSSRYLMFARLPPLLSMAKRCPLLLTESIPICVTRQSSCRQSGGTGRQRQFITL